MLYTEWNTEDAIAVARKEEREEIAQNALAKVLSPEFVHEITGMDMKTIKSLQGISQD
jgi:hypothetical protein